MNGVRRIGIAGLGGLGVNIALNLADHGFAVAIYEKDESALKNLQFEIADRRIQTANSLVELAGLLDLPRTVMILSSCGLPAGAFFNELVSNLTPGDLVIDAEHTYYKDTDTRAESLSKQGIELLGVGLCGGEQCARYGASIMPGGSSHAYRRVMELFESIASVVTGERCVSYLGPRSAGHYVNMVHNGIERGVMQLIAETYDVMSRGFGMSSNAIREVYAQWYVSEASSNLLGILARKLRDNSGEAGAILFDSIFDEATRNRSGRWVSLEASALDVDTSIIDLAVAMQMLSSLEEGRVTLRRLLTRRPIYYINSPQILIDQLKRALLAAMTLIFDQGIALLAAASGAYEYALDLEAVVRIWRGSIIRSPLLQEIREALSAQPHLSNLLSDSHFARRVAERREDLRGVVRLAAGLGIPVPAFAASLAYCDAHQDRVSADANHLVEAEALRADGGAIRITRT